jgi:hypothetical protein
MNDALAIAILTTQREGLRALLLCLPMIDERHRGRIRSATIHALGAVEDAMGYPRTFPPREERHREREHA